MRTSQKRGELSGILGDFFNLEEQIKTSTDRVFLEHLYFNLKYQTNISNKLKMKELILQKDLSCDFYKKALQNEENLKIKEILFEKYIRKTKNIFSYYVFKNVLFKQEYVNSDVFKFALKTWIITFLLVLIAMMLVNNPLIFFVPFLFVSFLQIISKGYTCEKFSMAIGIFFIVALSPITVPLFIIAFLTILSEPDSLSIGFFYHY